MEGGIPKQLALKHRLISGKFIGNRWTIVAGLTEKAGLTVQGEPGEDLDEVLERVVRMRKSLGWDPIPRRDVGKKKPTSRAR